MTTADYALFVSLAAAFISILALLWNVWQKYIFVKPDLQVGFAIMDLMAANPSKPGTMTLQGTLIGLSVTNMGPGPVTLYACVVRMKRKSWRFWRSPLMGILNPMQNPGARVATSLGPFTGLPAKIDAGEMKSFHFPYDKNCILNNTLTRVGINDTYSRNSWCRRRDVKKALARFKKDFPDAVPTPVQPAPD